MSPSRRKYCPMNVAALRAQPRIKIALKCKGIIRAAFLPSFRLPAAYLPTIYPPTNQPPLPSPSSHSSLLSGIFRRFLPSTDPGIGDSHFFSFCLSGDFATLAAADTAAAVIIVSDRGVNGPPSVLSPVNSSHPAARPPPPPLPPPRIGSTEPEPLTGGEGREGGG